MPETRGVVVTKVIYEPQLQTELAAAGYPGVAIAILGDPATNTSKRVWADGVPDATLTTVVNAHTAAPPADADNALDSALSAATDVAGIKSAVRAWIPARKVK